MATKKKPAGKEPISKFLTDETQGDSVKTATDSEMVKDLTKLQDEAGSMLGKGSLTLNGATPAQTKEVQEALTAGYTPQDVVSQVFGKTAAAKKGSTASNDKTLQEFANTLATQYANQPLEAIGQEGTDLANENKAITNSLLPQFTGAAAEAAGGATPDAALQAAMDAYSKAYASSEGVNSGLYAQSGLANEQYLASSPEASYLQLLSQPGSAYYKEIPAALMQNLPESLQYALQNIGQVNEGAAVTTPKGGWPAAVKNEFGVGANSNANVANSLTAGLGTVPGSPTSPTSLNSGNPNTPGS